MATMTKAEVAALNAYWDGLRVTYDATVVVAESAIAEGVTGLALSLARSYTNRDHSGLWTSQYETALQLMPYAGPHAEVIGDLVSVIMEHDRLAYSR